MPPEGWVLYDADCVLCSRWAARMTAILARRGFELESLRSPRIRDSLQLDPEQLSDEMQVVTSHGRIAGGADAIIYLARRIWWAWPLFLLSGVPGVTLLLRKAYRWLAAHRHRFHAPSADACRLRGPHRVSWPAWIALAVLPGLALALRPWLPPWGFMWVTALALFGGFKWLTWWQARHRTHTSTSRLRRSLGYLLLWPGMNARAFLESPVPVPETRRQEWMAALLKSFLGAALLWGVARQVPQSLPLLQGWVGLAGLVLLLHFGVFHLLALLWRSRGVPVRPIMNAPLRATSPSDFWARWNVAFNDLALEWLLRPLRRWIGLRGALVAAFLASGLIHELVISVPAGAGYGLPTGYFVLQGLALLLERSSMGMRLHLDCGWRGRLFAAAVVAGPVFWLFHPPFVSRVALPFMKATGAL